MLSTEEQLHIIQSGTYEIKPVADLKKKLDRGTPLTVKLGVDPTTPDLHIGHAVPFRKLRQFQDLGHEATLIIGDGTACIGDPSGRNSTRPQLSHDEIMENAQTYVNQAMKILDEEKTHVCYNSEWIFDLDLGKLLSILSNFTVARILERDDFHKRYTNQQPIAVHEFLYPIMQAYDSVMVKADVEIGGSDQLFNLLAGRELMEKMGMEPQVTLTLPLLEGTDGVRKMSKSYSNYVGLTDKPSDMFGKVMSIPDEMIVKYFRLATALPVAKIDEIEQGLKDDSLHPNKIKRSLAREIVSVYYDTQTAQEAENQFDRVFKKHDVPEDIAEFNVELLDDPEKGGVYLPNVLLACKLAKSGGEGRRLIDGGGFKVNSKAVPAKTYHMPASKLKGAVLQAGKRRFAKLV